MNRILVIVCICSVVVMGYGKAESEPAPKQKGQPPSLLIGLIPEQNIFKQIERYEPVTGYLSKKMGINIELKVLTRYGNIIDNFVSLSLDGAFFGSFTYALTHAKIGVEAVARPENLNGISTYHGLLFVRKDSGIKSAEDMAGKRFAFVDKATTAGYILPLAYFKEHGIGDYRTFLKETYFTGTHEDAIYDVLNNKADIGAAKNTIFLKLSAVDSRIKNKLIILQRSPEVPENCLAVSKDLEVSVNHKLKHVFLNMHTDPEGIDVLVNFGAEKFIETTNDDYASVYQYAQEIGLNLEIYDYLND